MTKFSTRREVYNKSNETRIITIDFSKDASVIDKEGSLRNAFQERNIFIRIGFEDGTSMLAEIQE